MCSQLFTDKIPCYAVIQMIKQPEAKKEEVKTEEVKVNTDAAISDNYHDGMYLTFESYERNLMEILNAVGNFQNEVIFGEIESEFGGIDGQNKVFIRALVSAACRCCIDDNDTRLNKVKLSGLCALLSIFISRNQEFEFETFFAIKSVQQKLPNQPGIDR